MDDMSPAFTSAWPAKRKVHTSERKLLRRGNWDMYNAPCVVQYAFFHKREKKQIFVMTAQTQKMSLLSFVREMGGRTQKSWALTTMMTARLPHTRDDGKRISDA